MQITVRIIGNCTILELNGRLVLGTDLIDLRNAVRDAARDNPSKIILNLARVTYVDSCGIGELISTLTHLKNSGGNLVLTDLPKRVRTLLDTAKLIPVFEVSDSEQAALTNLKQQVPLHQLCN